MIHRDHLGIIVQHDIYNPEHPGDGGDSCNRTAFMSIGGSEKDTNLLWSFIRFYRGSMVIVRHPSQVPWDNPLNATRDQLVPFMAALKLQGSDLAIIANRALLKAARRRKWKAQNIEADHPGTKKKWPNGADYLDPGVRYFMHLCANEPMTRLQKILGIIFIYLSIFWSSKIKPDSEQNQLISMLLVLPVKYLRLYMRLNHVWEQNVFKYWSGWRDQAEISVMLVKAVKKKLDSKS